MTIGLPPSTVSSISGCHQSFDPRPEGWQLLAIGGVSLTWLMAQDISVQDNIVKSAWWVRWGIIPSATGRWLGKRDVGQMRERCAQIHINNDQRHLL